MTSSLTSSSGYRPLLYTFSVGERVFRRTDNQSALLYQQKTYENFPGGLLSAGSLESAEKPFVMRLAARDSLAHVLLNAVDFETVSLDVKSSPSAIGEEAEPLWSGSVASITMEGEICLLEGQSLLNQWREEAYPSLRFQTQCAHRLYDNNCAVREEDVRVITLITRLSGVSVDVKDIAKWGDGWFSAGVMTLSSGQQRTIMHHQGNTMTIAFPLRDVSKGERVTLLPGCDHTPETCLAKYNNLRRYGGFTTLPLINPFDDGV